MKMCNFFSLTAITPKCSEDEAYLFIVTGPSIHTAQGLTVQRPRAKATLTATPRLTAGGLTKPTTITVSRPGMVIPVGAQGITTTRTVGGKPGIHIKQEGGECAMCVIST